MLQLVLKLPDFGLNYANPGISISTKKKHKGEGKATKPLSTAASP
jgi:hypothetical protein